MGFWDNPFGGLFDINNDGKEDFAEQWLAYNVFNECNKSSCAYDDDDDEYEWRLYRDDGRSFGVDPFEYETEEEYEEALHQAKYGWRETCEDGSEYFIYPTNYETEAAYLEALNEEKYGWRIFCEDGSAYGIDPEDYETEDEFEDALEQAKYGWREICEDGSLYNIDPEKYETEEAYLKDLDDAKTFWRNHRIDGITVHANPQNLQSISDAKALLEQAKARSEQLCGNSVTTTIDTDLSGSQAAPSVTYTISYIDDATRCGIVPEAYPSQRIYKAAKRKFHLEHGPAFIPPDSTPEEEIAKCDAILNPIKLVDRYITISNGIMLCQAVKDHFDTPVKLPDEDDQHQMLFDTLLQKVAEKDVDLAIRIWKWCIREFGPYRKAMSYLACTMYDNIYSFPDRFPPEFITAAVAAFGSDPQFCRDVFTFGPSFPLTAYELIVEALMHNNPEAARAIFTASVSYPSATDTQLTDLIWFTLSKCRNWQETRTIRLFQSHLLPVIYRLNNKAVKQALPVYRKEIAEYLRQR